jgi:hypothetical protein
MKGWLDKPRKNLYTHLTDMSREVGRTSEGKRSKMNTHPEKPIIQSSERTPYNEAMEPLAHRLTLRLAQYWTHPQHLLSNDGMIAWTVQELFDQTGIQPSRENPKRTKSRLERALDLLRRDNIIGSYSMRVQGDPIAIQEAEQCLARYAPGWWSLYAAQTVFILPPKPVEA